MSSVWVVTHIDSEAETHVFDEEEFAKAYAGACAVADLEVHVAQVPINDRVETAERIRETIQHLDRKAGV